jgi:predicted signal transduction protein with EAL and GGDEF domain
LAAPFGLNGHELYVSASVGIALFPLDGQDSEALVSRADIAMYDAKRRGRGRCSFYSETMNQDGARRIQMEPRLRRALREGRLRLEYQPLVEAKSGRIASVEALLRWDDPVLGAVQPDEFIPVAEAIGLLTEIGAWVIQQACAELARVRAEDPEGAPKAQRRFLIEHGCEYLQGFLLGRPEVEIRTNPPARLKRASSG